MFASGRKLILSNLLHQSLTVSYLLLLLHICIPDSHEHQWISVYSISKGNANLKVQHIPTQRAVTRQEHAMWWSGISWKPHPQQECNLLLFVISKCCFFAGKVVGVGSCWCHLAPNISLLHLQPEWPAWTRASSKAFSRQWPRIIFGIFFQASNRQNKGREN